MKPELVQKYVESGTLRIEWRDFPAQGQESVNAALAARAAQAQGKFWEYHDILYDNQSSGNSGGYSEENLSAFAEEVGLDVDRFEKDARGERASEAVTADFTEAQDKGFSGTPTFIINGQTLVGFQTIEVFEKVIEDAEEEAAGG